MKGCYNREKCLRRFIFLLTGLVFTLVCVFPPVNFLGLNDSILLAQEPQIGNRKGKSPAQQNVTLDFDNVDIRLVIKTMSDLLGKNFLIDDGVRGNVTIISPEAIPVDEAYKVFESILEVKGFAAVPSGSIIKIVPAKEALSKNIEMRTETLPEGVGQDDALVTQIIPVENANVEAIKGVIASLVSKNSKLITYPPTNTIILVENVSNIERLIKIIKEIDVPAEDALTKIVFLKYASPDVISKQILGTLEDNKAVVRRTRGGKTVAPDPALKTKIIPDDRTGSLIIVADEEKMESILDLINSLDIPTPRGKDNIKVRPLKNGKAEDIVKALEVVLNKQESLAKKGGPEAGQLIQNSVITADKATNSLIIMASPQDYEIISRIIDELDIMRPQVLVEALIAEVTFDKTKELGVEWRTLDNPQKGSLRGFAGTSYGRIESAQAGIIPDGLSIGVTRGYIKVGGVNFPNIAALINAYQSDSDVNILSTPHILTTDTEEAKILVGEEYPFRVERVDEGVSYYSNDYKNIGLTLVIVPYINPDGYVKLEIAVKIDEVVELVGGVPRTNNREAETTVVVKDQQTVVIGGLLKDGRTKSYNRVPFFGELPLLGWLFRNMSKNNRKTNLQVFLTPHIIYTPEDLQRLTFEKGASLDLKDVENRLDKWAESGQDANRIESEMGALTFEKGVSLDLEDVENRLNHGAESGQGVDYIEHEKGAESGENMDIKVEDVKNTESKNKENIERQDGKESE